AVGYWVYDATNPYTGTIDDAGAVWVFSGGASGGGPALIAPSGAAATSFSTGYAWKMEGASSNAYVGYDTAPAGDLDADGTDDLAITTYRASSYLVYGPLDTTGASYTTSDADATFSGLKYAVEPAGDVDADGYDDIWVGSDSLYLFSGTPR
ncbi:MAG: hypothetical protein FJ090_22945, partial [Deltaproteobacteria bacterium]|nr:hypothetical protein [Deltaproteobacteria bacterium]